MSDISDISDISDTDIESNTTEVDDMPQDIETFEEQD